jgi:hypothetical protein
MLATLARPFEHCFVWFLFNNLKNEKLWIQLSERRIAEFYLCKIKSRENLVLNESCHAGAPGDMPRATARFKGRIML